MKRIGFDWIHDLAGTVTPPNQRGQTQQEAAGRRHDQRAHRVNANASAQEAAGRQQKVRLMQKFHNSTHRFSHCADNTPYDSANEDLHWLIRAEVPLESRKEEARATPCFGPQRGRLPIKVSVGFHARSERHSPDESPVQIVEA
jgi:hypothetical protein